jgi:hypothetical protein
MVNMVNIKLSRRNLFALFVGLLIIDGIGIVTSTISLFMASNVMRTIPFDEIRDTFSQQSMLVLNQLLRMASSASPLLGGFVVGRLVKEKGWLYGCLLGFVLTITSIGIVSLTFLLPTPLIYGQHFPSGYGYDLAQKNILNQLLYTPIIVVLTTLGGFFGENYSKKQKAKNNGR